MFKSQQLLRSSIHASCLSPDSQAQSLPQPDSPAAQRYHDLTVVDENFPAATNLSKSHINPLWDLLLYIL